MILANPTIRTFEKIILGSTSKDFDGLDFEKLEKSFMRYICEHNIWNTKTLSVALGFIIRLPFNETHLELMKIILRQSKSTDRASYDYRLYIDTLTDFMKTHIVKDLTGTELLSCIFSRPDFELLITAPPDGTLRKAFFVDETTNFETRMEELFNIICEGKIDSIGHAIATFEFLKERKIEIVNYWAEHDMTLEVDVYGMYLIESSGCKNFTELDEQYIASKNKRQDSAKSYANRPVTGDTTGK